VRTNQQFTTASPAAVAAIAPCERPDVSFVIVAYGSGPILIETIESLSNSMPGIDAELIVVDNPHPKYPDRSVTELRLFTSGVHVIRPDRNLGFGGGCELGALHARADVLAFVNPDVTVSSGWLARLLATLADDPSISILAPMLRNRDGSVQEAGQRLYADGSTVPCTTPPVTEGVEAVDYSSAACWLIRSDEHERLGGFDSAYHPAYFEDVDLALRARSLGGRCVVDRGVSVIHHQGSGTPDKAMPAEAQRATLLTKWPDVRWLQEPSPSR
jgi:GT2 family glycosyltransferase